MADKFIKVDKIYLEIVKEDIEKIHALAYVSCLAGQRDELSSLDTHYLMGTIIDICNELDKYTCDWSEKDK